MNGGLRVENSSATIHTSTAPLAEESAICFLRGDLIAVEVLRGPSPNRLILFSFDKTDVTAALHTRDLDF